MNCCFEIGKRDDGLFACATWVEFPFAGDSGRMFEVTLFGDSRTWGDHGNFGSILDPWKVGWVSVCCWDVTGSFGGVGHVDLWEHDWDYIIIN